MILISSCLLIVQCAFSQNVYIPDENFKNRLIELGIDTNNDGEISYEEAAAVTGELNLSTQQIADATGIEAFINVKYLNLNNNQLSNLDLSANESLKQFSCRNNGLTSLIFHPVKDLKIVDCGNNNLTYLNTNNAWSTLHKLYCDHNQLSNLSINQPGLQIIDCGYNQLYELYINAQNGKLTEVLCNNNNLTNIEISGRNKIELLEGSYNSINHIKTGHTINELILNYLNTSELDISEIPFINDLYIENNEPLEKLCIRFYPIHYEIHDDGSNNYSTQICNVPSGDSFYAGQVIHAFNHQWELDGDLGDDYYDLNNDGIDDLYFEIEVIDDYGGELIYTIYSVTPLNNNLILSYLQYGVQGLNFGDTINPCLLNWDNGEMGYYTRTDSFFGGSWWDWELEEGYFGVLIPEENDTSYCWVKIDFNFEYFYPSGLNGFACWTKCINSIDLGEDIEALLDDNYIFDAGEGFDTYLWNTGETSQSIIVDCSIIGEGIHTYSILAKDEGCYYTDTINIQIGDDIGIDDLQFEQISLGSNPFKDFITIQNLKEQDLQFEIIDIRGRRLLRKRINKRSEKINVQELPTGLYFCRIYSSTNSRVFKMVKN
jgi:hypothetical protein